MTIVDTSVWSLALRRHVPVRHPSVDHLEGLVLAGQVAMLGVIRQELLCGVKRSADFLRLRDRLRAFPDVALVAEDHEQAAECFNACRIRGVQGSNTDFLICAVADRRGFDILTTDADFERFAGVLPIRLRRPTE